MIRRLENYWEWLKRLRPLRYGLFFFVAAFFIQMVFLISEGFDLFLMYLGVKIGQVIFWCFIWFLIGSLYALLRDEGFTQIALKSPVFAGLVMFLYVFVGQILLQLFRGPAQFYYRYSFKMRTNLYFSIFGFILGFILAILRQHRDKDNKGDILKES